MAGNRTNSLLLVALACLLCVPQRSAWAAGTTDAKQSERTPIPFQACERDPECLRLYQGGRGYAQRQQYDEALMEYKSAYERVPTPLLLLNIGRMQHKSGRLEQAIASYQAFLLAPLHPKDAAGRQAARKYLEEAGAALAERKSAPNLRVQDPQPTPVQPEPTLEKPPAAKQPVYRKWWFWTGLGGIVVAGVGVGIVIALTTKPNYPEPGLHPF